MNTQQSNGTSNQTALESEPASDEGQGTHQLACMEVWGGTRQVRLEVRLSGLAAWVCSMPIESSTGGGDVHYLSVCNAGLVSKIVLADVSGHGPEVNTVAQLLLRLMHRYINDWDQSDFMRDLDRDFPGDRLGSPYATAVLLSFTVKSAGWLSQTPAIIPHSGFTRTRSAGDFSERIQSPPMLNLPGYP